jgi:LPXTG-motif cell wall-anchored protein
MATPAAAFAADPSFSDPPLTPIVFSHTNLKDCDQIAPTSDDELLTSGGTTQSATVPGVGSGTLTDNNTMLDVHIEDGHSVTAIIVKGGDNSNVYFFDPAVGGPADFLDLNAPTNNGGNPNPTISHWLVCGVDEDTPPPPSFDVTSEVHLDDTHAVVDNSHPATAPADVHDSIIVTASGVQTWSGTVTVYFFHGGNCGDPADAVEHASVPVNQGTSMPLDDVLPQSGLAAGDYSYAEVFSRNNTDVKVEVNGPCEPFKVVDGPTDTPSPSPSLPKTGDNVGGIAVTGGVLLAAGIGMVAYVFVARRRRSATESAN